MSFVLLNDTHCGARGASTVVERHQAAFYGDVLFPYMLKHGIKTILHLGDYYDNRNHVPVSSVNANRKMFLDPLRKHGMRMIAIPGNHDIKHTDNSDICSLKELLGYYKDCVDLVLEPKVIDIDGTKIGLVPWINRSNYEASMEFIDTVKNINLLAGHFEIAGFEMHAGHKAEHGMSAKLFERFPMVLSGHFHTKSTQSNISYLGTQFELTWADFNDPKFFHVYDSTKDELKAVRNPNKLFYKLIYSDEAPDIDLGELKDKYVRIIVSNRDNDDKYHDFLSDINAAGCADISIIDNHILMSDGDDESFDDIEFQSNKDIMDKYVTSIGLEEAIESSVSAYLSKVYDAALTTGVDG